MEEDFAVSLQVGDDTRHMSGPVIAAAIAGDVKKLKDLLSHGLESDYTVKDTRGFTPMSRAAQKGHLECVKLLFDSAWKIFLTADKILEKACPEIRIFDFDISFNTCYAPQTPISLAAEHGHESIVNILAPLYSGASARETGYALHRACAKKKIECIKILVSKFQSHLDEGDFNRQLPLHIVAKVASMEALGILLDSENDAEKQSQLKNINECDVIGCTPLHYAARSGNLDLVQLLLKKGADPSIKDGGLDDIKATPLTTAVRDGKFEIVKLLADISPPDCEATFEAAYRLQPECLKYLLMKGFPLFTQSFKAHDDKDPLDFLLFDGENWYSDMPSVVRILLENGVNFDELATSEYTAILPNYLEIVAGGTIEVFLEYGLAELRMDCQYHPDLKKFSNLIKETGISFFYELISQRLQIDDDDKVVTEDDSQHLRSNLSLYLEYFPFVKLDVERPLNVESLHENVLPKCPSLSELCRWTIRCCMASKHGMLSPEHVRKLPLPKALKHFVLYKKK